MAWNDIATCLGRHATLVVRTDSRILTVWKDSAGANVQTLLVLRGRGGGGAVHLVADIAPTSSLPAARLSAEAATRTTRQVVAAGILCLLRRVPEAEQGEARLADAAWELVLEATRLRRQLTVTITSLDELYAGICD